MTQEETEDIRGNVTTTTQAVDPGTGTMVSSITVPTSVQPQVLIQHYGLLVESISATAVTNRYAYDALNRRVSVIDGRGNTTTTAYNALGQVAYVEDAATNRTTYVYDQYGRRVETVDALNQSTHTVYNLRGSVVRQYGATYPVWYVYDAEGRMTAMATTRDTNLNPATVDSLDNPSLDVTQWTYDPATGLLVQKLYDDGKGPSYTYTPDGKLETRTWARGVVTEYGYDEAGELASVQYSDGTPPILKTYNRLGSPVSIISAGTTNIFEYSATTLEKISDTQLGYAIRRGYDNLGRMETLSITNLYDGSYAYDVFGRFATSSFEGLDFHYASLPGADLVNGLTYGAVKKTVAFEAQRNLVTGISYHTVADTLIAERTYTYNALGNVVARTRQRGAGPVEADDFDHNLRSELIAASLGGTNAVSGDYGYAYDPIGNRVVATNRSDVTAYASNELNQYTNIVSEVEFTPAFDDDGNQTLVKTSTGIWHVAYNAENRPVVWSNGTAVVTMDYDRMGRRVWYASVSGTQTNAFAKFVYDGYLCVQKLDGTTGNIEQEYVWDPTETVATRPLKWTLPGLGRNFHYFHDGNKNVSDVVDASDGSLPAHYDYAPFGAVTSATGPLAAVNPYRFSSEYHDDALGCVYYNFRHYNPLDGKWLNRDLLQERGGINLSVFLNNSPMFRYDFLGLSILDTIIDKLNCWLNPGKLEYVSHSFSPPTGEEFEYARKTSIGLILIGSNPYGVGMDSTIYLPFHIYDWGGATDGSAKVKNRVTCRKRCQCVAKCKSECCGDYEKKIKDIYIYGRVFSRWLGGPWSPAQYALAWPDIPEKQLWADGYCELYAGGEENAKRECERMAKEKCNSL